MTRFRDSVDRNACGCCNMSLEHGSQLVAVYNIIVGLLIFLATLVLYLKDLHKNKIVPIPYQLMITFIFLGIFQASCGLLLYFVAGCRSRMANLIWLALWIPLTFLTIMNITNIVNIYGLLVFYQLTREVKMEKVDTNMEVKQEDLVAENSIRKHQGNNKELTEV